MSGGRPSRGQGVREAGVLLAALGLLGLGACASRPPLPLRPEPIAYADTLPGPEPAVREDRAAARRLKQTLVGQTSRPFDLRRLLDRRRPAVNLTRFDDVVASSWFEHRIAADTLSPDELAAGAAAPPDTAGPLTVVAGARDGRSPRLTVEDARGRRFLLRFDPGGHPRPHLAGTAAVVSSRLLGAAGYRVQQRDRLAVDAARLRLAPDAAMARAGGGERPMTTEDLRELLGRTDTLPDGRHPALARRPLPGEPKGPFRFSGRRADDANDHYLHQHRRELRGLYVLAAWLNYVEVGPSSTATSWVEPGHLRHYLTDFGATLGSAGTGPHRPRDGAEHVFGFWPAMGRLLSLGFYRAGWEGRDPGPLHPEAGWMPVEEFDPGAWRPDWPNPAFWSMTARDAYWAARLVAAFTDAHLRAAVRAAGLPDPAAADTLAAALVHRRDTTVAHWYARVTPLEDPRARTRPGDRGSTLAVAFRDLGLEEGIWGPGQTTYRWRLRHPAAGLTRRGTTPARPGSRQRIEAQLPRPPAGLPRDGEGALATLDVTAERPGATGRKAVVHLRWVGRERGYRVVGLEH